jgi:hypothetical protein
VQRRPDAALEVALEQRQRTFEQTQLVLSERERAFGMQAQALANAKARVRLILAQMDAAQRPAPGMALAVGLLGDLERILGWCEDQVRVEEEKLEAARVDTEEARGWMAIAHQQVRALELVLAARARERAEKAHRLELRQADETAARVHARKVARG